MLSKTLSSIVELIEIAQRIALMSVLGQHTFYNNLYSFLGLIGHWAGDSEISRSHR